MKLLKPLAIVIGGLGVLVAAAIGYVAATFDVARVKSEIERVALSSTGRQLKIQGPLTLKVFPSVAIEVGEVRVGERDHPELEFATVERARVSVRLLPLFARQVRAERIELSGVKLRIVRGKDGRRNIDDLAGDPAAGSGAGAKTEAAPLPEFEVAGIRIDKSAVTYVDEQAKRTFNVHGFSLETGRIANAADGRFSLSGQAALPEGNLAISLRGSYRYDLAAAKYGIEALEGGVKGDLAGMRDVDAALAVGLASASREGFQVDKLSFKLKAKQGSDTIDAVLDLPKLAVVGGKASGETLKLDAKIDGAGGPMKVSIAAAELAGGDMFVNVGRLTLLADGRRGELGLNARLDSSLKVELPAHIAEVARVSGEVTIAHPAMPMKSAKVALTGRTRVDWAKPSASGEATLKFDETTLQSKWSVAAFSPLAIGADIQVDRLNVDRYFPPAPRVAVPTAGQKPAAEAPAAKSVADPAIDLKGLQGIDATASLRIGALQVTRVKLENLKTDVRLRGGRLDVPALSAALYGGAISGSASIDSHGNKLTLRQRLEGVNVNPLMRDALDRDLVEGRGSVAYDVQTQGATVGAMKKGLAGSASVTLRDGAVKGINLAKSFRELKAKLSSKQDAQLRAVAEDKTDFSELSASFRIAAGVARNDDLSMKSPFLRLGGAGDIDIGNGTMNYVAKASVVSTSGGQGGKDLEHLKGLTVPVLISGPFEALNYRLEFAGLLQEAAKAQVQEKVQQKIEGKFGDKLKGLLKR